MASLQERKRQLSSYFLLPRKPHAVTIGKVKASWNLAAEWANALFFIFCEESKFSSVLENDNRIFALGGGPCYCEPRKPLGFLRIKEGSRLSRPQNNIGGDWADRRRAR